MKIQLPELAYITQHKLGPIKYVIRRAEEVEITKIDSERKGKSPLDIYTLANGEQILITATKTTVRPVGIVGVLMKVGSTTHWIYHERLEEVEELVRSKGLGALRQRVEDSWQAGFKFASEFADATGKTIRSGLRPPQLGALFAIGSHWSLSKQPATIVMPTGTGKTETMLASTVAFHRGTTLVGVPSAPLKEQTARKFYSLGLLPKLGLVTEPVLNPVVGIMNRRPKAQAELDIFEQCNVVIATMSVLAQGESVPLISEMAKRSNQLVIDEAHHIAAGTWHEFRKSFIGERILQFTATPFRRDGKVVDGKVIYNYPLGQAQRDGYFKRIAFEPVREIDEDKADEKIAVAALKQLQHDLGKGHNHLVMARCESISRAESVLKIYERLAADHHPLLVHSQDAKASRHRIQELMEGRSQIVVCVDMLGEGFDLPALKIAAIHDVHKSLGIILQFAGRFTRSSGQNLGDATIIANIADQQFSEALERLYSEDADWNQVLSELSSEAAKSHAQLMAFVQDCERLTSDDAPHHVEIGPSSLEPMLSTVVFKVAKFVPKKFVDWLKMG